MPSSVIKAFAYAPDTERLAITFVNGRRYAYAPVPAAVADGLATAESKGRYFAMNVRDLYPFERLR